MCWIHMHVLCHFIAHLGPHFLVGFVGQEQKYTIPLQTSLNSECNSVIQTTQNVSFMNYDKQIT